MGRLNCSGAVSSTPPPDPACLCGAQCVCSNCNSANIQHALEYADIGAYTLGNDIVVGQPTGATGLINSGQVGK